MKTPLKLAIILVVAGLVAGAVVLKKAQSPAARAPAAVAAALPPAIADAPRKLPKLLDLGAGKCIPCKKMAPILEELKKEFAGKMEVEFVDVWQNPDAGNKYGIRLIPTQIFYDATGKELFRHEGFFGREDILGKWKELGVGL
jgi:thioredoxin 1